MLLTIALALFVATIVFIRQPWAGFTLVATPFFLVGGLLLRPRERRARLPG
jgi:hypothetical protein